MSSRRFMGRSLARSQALQLLFQAELRGLSVAEILEGPYALCQIDPLGDTEEQLAGEPLDEYGEQLARGADERRHELDCVISQASTNWPIGRMPSVDRNLLRLALYEMIFEDAVDVAISIDESVELAKAYGTDASSGFVNGVLGRVASDIASGMDVIEVAVRRVREEAEAKAAAQREAEAAEAAAAEQETGADEAGTSEAAGESADTQDDVASHDAGDVPESEPEPAEAMPESGE